MSKLKIELNKKQLENSVKVLQGISHPVRLTILHALTKEELSVNDLSNLASVSQSVTSQHLGKMKDAGILESRKESNKVFYYIKDPKYKDLIKQITKLFI